jgi:peptidase A4-like protein
MKSLSGMEKIIFRTLIIAFLTIGAWKNARRAEATIAPRHYPIQVLRRTDGRVARSLLNQMTSTNWSGYVAASFGTGQTYTSAQGTWVVPAVTYFPGFATEYSSSWVGIGGFCENSNCASVDNSLLQLGTEQDASSSGTRYYAWYEALPSPIKKIPMTISPGDVITVSLQLTSLGKKNQSWTLSMEDATGAQTWSTTLNYKSSQLSAEWIEEAPSSPGGILPLAEYGPNATVSPAPEFDFGLTDFSTTNSGSPSLTTSEGLVMYNPWGQTSNPSSIDSDSDGFNTCWGDGVTQLCSPAGS